MGYTLLEFMKSIGIFMICAQSLIYFAAEKSYEKYIKVLVGIMILAQFIVPIRSLLLGAESGEMERSILAFQEDMESAIEKGIDGAEIFYEKNGTGSALGGAEEEEKEKIRGLLQEEVKQKLQGTAQEYGYGIDEVLFREEPPGFVLKVSSRAETAEAAGEGDSVSIDKSTAVEAITISDGIGIKVEIGADEEAGDGQGSKDMEKSPVIGAMKKEFCILLGVDEEYLEVR